MKHAKHGCSIMIGALALSTGCFPAVTHGPRVESGGSIGLTAGLTRGPEHVEGDEGGINLRKAVVGPFAGYGFASTSPQLPALYLGLAVPLYFPFAQVDAYLQAPPAWTGRMSAGAGVVADMEGVTPYVQLGFQPERDIGWFVSAGYNVRHFGANSAKSSSPAWHGTAALSLPSGYLRSNVFVQYASGRIPGSCFADAAGRRCTQGEQATAFAFGASIARASRNVGRRGR